MARTAFRTVILSAALAAWALAAGAPVLAATQTGQAGPSLAPAKYKPLPVGTKVKYDTWSYTVTKSDGFDITYKTDHGQWRHSYAVFGRHERGAYNPQKRDDDWYLDLDDKSRSALESLWPLKVGKKIVLDLEEKWSTAETGYSGEDEAEFSRLTVNLEVLRTEFLVLDGVRYATFVIGEHATGENPFPGENVPSALEYSETRWYEPGSGLILKSVKDWTRGPKKGGTDEYSLVRVRFPGGTKTHVLAGTRISGGADTQLTAEVARLKAEAEAKQKVMAEMRGRETEERRRQREAQQRLSDQVARLMRDAEERRTAGKQAPAGQKGTVRQAGLAKYSGINFGRYYALVIGNNEYKYLPNLKTAAGDARAVADVLGDTYGFDVTLLIDATRADIVDALDEFREKLDDTTNLLIYYAGHGWLDEAAEQGFWLPVDAKPNRRSNWVANSTITGSLRALNSKHVMVVADSCYSGTLVRGIKIKENTPDYIRRMAGKRARLALTSGGLEPVADRGGGKHSPFAAAFIDVLNANTSVIDGTQLFSQMRRPVILNSDQTPQYSDVRKAGHEGGDFLFVRKR
ncbi:MAG: caspase family protein [Proteobacteria bacterium]|nr:caspase family protein [Pseudomonadota bacterium]